MMVARAQHDDGAHSRVKGLAPHFPARDLPGAAARGLNRRPGLDLWQHLGRRLSGLWQVQRRKGEMVG